MAAQGATATGASAKGAVFITGSAGFIGYHLAEALLAQGYTVVGYDGLTDYYDVALKRERHARLSRHDNFSAHVAMLEDHAALREAILAAEPDAIIHLAAQAGVRYSLEQPRAYHDANLTGAFNLLECAREAAPAHLMMASTSSVYGASEDLPFHELQSCDTPLTLYAATKRANEAMAHSHAHLWNLPTTMFRFFTVYGPWGRPDMALFRFTRNILEGRPIDLHNHGKMRRDFTYVADLVRAIRLLLDCPPPPPGDRGEPVAGDSLSPAAPWRVVNIGNGEAVELMAFVRAIEEACGREARINPVAMHPGEVPATWADTSLLQALTGYAPKTDISEGVAAFVDWYREYNAA